MTKDFAEACLIRSTSDPIFLVMYLV